MADPLIQEHITHATFVRAEAGRVYDALATGQGFDSWFTQGAVIEPRAGGDLLFRWRDWGPDHVDAQDRGRVLEYRRPERFVFEWHPDGDSYATTVEMTFEAVDGGTVVRLREHGYRDTPSGRRAMLECAAGWGEALTLAKFQVEHGLRY